MKRARYGILMIILMILFLAGGVHVHADTGPKPTLDIFVENVEDSNYYLDLLGKEGEYGYFEATHGNDEYNHLHNEPIYNYAIDGWKAIHMRTWVLSGKLAGQPVEKNDNSKITKMKHSFGYVGVPKRFKIIIQKPGGALQISSEIINNHFNAVVRYDMRENKVISITGSNDIQINKEFIKGFTGLSDYLKRLLITLTAEILIALSFSYSSMNKIKVIGITNVITQTMLTLIFIAFYGVAGKLFNNAGYLILLILGETIVLLMEYLIYNRAIEKYRMRVFMYTLIANAASFTAGVLMLK